LVFTPPTVSDVPLLFPISVVVPAGTTRVIDFPTEFLGVAVNLNFTNNDGANAASYRVGYEAMNARNLPASNFRTISNTNVKQVSVTAGAGGTVLVEAQAYPIERAEIAGVVAT
tara:strand:- start:688 stop:1029 length:342 start_codon:yes stop_codon:yes gene_type:complete